MDPEIRPFVGSGGPVALAELADPPFPVQETARPPEQVTKDGEEDVRECLFC